MMYLSSPLVWLFLLLNYAFLDYIYLGMKPGYEHGYIRFLKFLLDIFNKIKSKNTGQNVVDARSQLKQSSKTEPRSTTFLGDSTMTYEEFSQQRAEVARNERLNLQDKENEISKYKSWREAIYWIVPVMVVANCVLTYAFANAQPLIEPILQENSMDTKQKPPALNPAAKGSKKQDKSKDAEW